MPLTVWRLLVAASATAGVALAAVQYDVWWTALSQLASVAVAVTYAGLAAYPFLTGRPEPRSPWLRGAMATLMVLVSLAFLGMQHGNLWDPYSVFEHLLTPARVIADYLLVGRNQADVRWWHPLSWLLPPLAYLAWYVGGDLGVYVALDASRPVLFGAHLGALLLLLLAAGFALYAAGCRRRNLVWAA